MSLSAKNTQPLHKQTMQNTPLLDAVSCPICKEIFNQPVSILCGHVFCESCLKKWISTRGKKCPYCSQSLQDFSPQPNAIKYFRSRTVQEIVVAFQQTGIQQVHSNENAHVLNNYIAKLQNELNECKAKLLDTETKLAKLVQKQIEQAFDRFDSLI